MILDRIQSYIQGPKNFIRVGLLGDERRGHLYLKPLSAAPTVAASSGAGRVWMESDGLHQSAHRTLVTDPLATKVLSAIYHTFTLDIASVADGALANASVTVPGAVVGDAVLVWAQAGVVGVTMHGYVSAANTVVWVAQNESGAAYDPASQAYMVLVIPKPI